MNGIENGRYLPVLYMIPIWKRFPVKIGNCKYLYSNDHESYIKLSKFEEITGISIQSHYNRHVLGIVDKNYIPKCPICGKLRQFKGYKYSRGCCTSHTLTLKNQDPEVRKKNSDGLKRYFKTDKGKDQLKRNTEVFLDNINSEESIRKRNESLEKFYESGGSFSSQLKNKDSKLSKYLYGGEEYSESIKNKRNTEEFKEEKRRLTKERRSGFSYVWDHIENLPENSRFGVSNRFEYGKYNSSKCIGKCYYRSSYEKKFLDILENSEIVIRYEVEPRNLKVRYYNYEKSNVRDYFVDYKIELSNGKIYVIEVKPWDLRNTPNNKSKRIECKRMCKSMGYIYRLITEFDLDIPYKGSDKNIRYKKFEL